MNQRLKQDLRKRILTLLRQQQENDRLAKSRQILAKLLQQQVFIKSSTVLFYAAFDGEVDTFDMIKEAQRLNKVIGLPKIIREERRLVPLRVDALETEVLDGLYGIKEPKDSVHARLLPEAIDLVVVPGIAFDKKNNRLGRGGGYYDRFLGSLPEHIPTIGLAFDFQIVDVLPSIEVHDIPVTSVLVN